MQRTGLGKIGTRKTFFDVNDKYVKTFLFSTYTLKFYEQIYKLIEKFLSKSLLMVKSCSISAHRLHDYFYSFDDAWQRYFTMAKDFHKKKLFPADLYSRNFLVFLKLITKLECTFGKYKFLCTSNRYKKFNVPTYFERQGGVST